LTSDDFKGYLLTTSTVGYFSDCWAFCFIPQRLLLYIYL